MSPAVGAADDDGFSKDLEHELTTGAPEPSRAETSLAKNRATANPTSIEDPSCFYPPMLVDDDLVMDIAFLSMHHLLNDPGDKSPMAEGIASSLAGLEPSVVSGTTDLFEGDLGDDELPSILMPHADDSQFEILQLNPLELVDEVQREVLDEAAADPDGHASLAAAVVDAAALPSPESLLRSHVTLSNRSTVHPELPPPQRKPVVPFVKIRKLSDAEPMTKKRPTTATENTPPTKKIKSAIVDESEASGVAEDDQPTPRMTRSRMKKAGIVAMAEGLPAKTRAKKESPAKATSNISLVFASGTSAKVNIRAPEPLPVAIASLSVSESVTSATDIIKEATETAKAATNVSIVTPVLSEDITNDKQMDVATKIKCESIPLPKLQSSSDAGIIDRTGNVAALKEAAAAMKEIPRKGTGPCDANKKATARRSSTRSVSTSSTGSATSLFSPVVIDMSTAHIQALTGENGASVCLGVRTCTFLQDQEQETSSTSDTNAPAKNNGSASSSAPLTEQERAQQSRDRNRKHARNTRLRKKAYVEELKQTLNELVAQRDRAQVVQEQNRQRELEQREVRFRVMEEFLKLRGRNVSETQRWSAILLPGFTLTMPITSSFQEMVSTSSDSQLQKLEGVENVMQDSRHFAAFLQTLRGSDAPRSDTVSLVYHCDRNAFMMDGCKAVLGWKAESVGASWMGSEVALSFNGSLQAHFCPESNRLRSTELIFDTGTIIKQRDALHG